MGAFAQLPVNLLMMILEIVGKVSMGAFAQLPVNPKPKIFLLISIGYKPIFGTIFDLKSRLFGMCFA